MTYCREATTPELATFTMTTDSEEPLGAEQHSQYRRVVGKVQWEAPVRLDCAFTIK